MTTHSLLWGWDAPSADGRARCSCAVDAGETRLRRADVDERVCTGRIEAARACADFSIDRGNPALARPDSHRNRRGKGTDRITWPGEAAVHERVRAVLGRGVDGLAVVANWERRVGHVVTTGRKNESHDHEAHSVKVATPIRSRKLNSYTGNQHGAL